MSGARFLTALQRRRSVVRDVGLADRRPTRSMPISHAIFDLRGVLYDDSAWRRWLLCLVTRMGLHTHYASFFRVWDREFQVEVWRGTREFWSALKEFLVAAGLSHGQADEVEAASRARFRAFEHDLRCFPGVIETLNRLTAARCEVTLLSRAMIRSNQLDWQLAKLGLDSQARRVVCTSGWGPEETEVQFRRLAGPQPGQVAYVGRDPRDLQAASRGGLLTIAFNYDADAQADVYIEQFDELLQVAELRDARMLAAG